MKAIKRICIFLMMFSSVAFLLTLAVQIFAHKLFDIHFRKIAAEETIAVQAGDRLNIYIAAEGHAPDAGALAPVVSIKGTREQALSVEPFAVRLQRPGENSEVIYAQGVYSLASTEPQELEIRWSNPRDGYFLAVSNSLMLSTVAFVSLIFFSLIGAALLYRAFGEKVLRRLTITQPQPD